MYVYKNLIIFHLKANSVKVFILLILTFDKAILILYKKNFQENYLK